MRGSPFHFFVCRFLNGFFALFANDSFLFAKMGVFANGVGWLIEWGAHLSIFGHEKTAVIKNLDFPLFFDVSGGNRIHITGLGEYSSSC